MKVSAERPSGANGPHDQRPGRQPESATFAAARVGGGGGRSPLIALGFIALLAGMVAIGIGGGPGGPSTGVPSPAAFAGSPSPAGQTFAHASPEREQPGGPAVTMNPTPGAAPIATSGPGPIQIQARRHPETMFVHGDVYVERVTWVFVSLQDDAGRVAGWASVTVPGAAGPGVGTGPTLRFDVELALSAQYQGRLWINANAYDADSVLIAAERVEVAPDGEAADEDTASPVRLNAPSRADEVVTTGSVLVDGRLAIRAATVRIALEADDARSFDSQIIDTANRDGGIRPVRAPTFHVELALPTPRPEGRLWIVITAYDEAGVSIGTLRRPIMIGEIAG